jgi:hypothetical protein
LLRNNDNVEKKGRKQPLSFRGACDEESQASAIIMNESFFYCDRFGQGGDGGFGHFRGGFRGLVPMNMDSGSSPE